MTEIALQAAAERYMASFQFEIGHYSPREFNTVAVFMNKAVSVFPVLILRFL